MGHERRRWYWKLDAERRKLVDAAEAAGWEVFVPSGGHLVFRSPSGGKVFAAATTGCQHSWKRTRAQLRRYGLAV